jgi:hypothetical protein
VLRLPTAFKVASGDKMVSAGVCDIMFVALFDTCVLAVES